MGPVFHWIWLCVLCILVCCEYMLTAVPHSLEGGRVLLMSCLLGLPPVDLYIVRVSMHTPVAIVASSNSCFSMMKSQY
jgi:hypothetical protein